MSGSWIKGCRARGSGLPSQAILCSHETALTSAANLNAPTTPDPVSRSSSLSSVYPSLRGPDHSQVFAQHFQSPKTPTFSAAFTTFESGLSSLWVVPKPSLLPPRSGKSAPLLTIMSTCLAPCELMPLPLHAGGDCGNGEEEAEEDGEDGDDGGEASAAPESARPTSATRIPIDPPPLSLLDLVVHGSRRWDDDAGNLGGDSDDDAHLPPSCWILPQGLASAKSAAATCRSSSTSSCSAPGFSVEGSSIVEGSFFTRPLCARRWAAWHSKRRSLSLTFQPVPVPTNAFKSPQPPSLLEMTIPPR
jgi:hypothetical protein